MDNTLASFPKQTSLIGWEKTRMRRYGRVEFLYEGLFRELSLYLEITIMLAFRFIIRDSKVVTYRFQVGEGLSELSPELLHQICLGCLWLGP